jgi:hypothetical protein
MEFDMLKWNYRIRKCLWCSNDRFTIRKVIEKTDFRKTVLASKIILQKAKAMSLFTPKEKAFSHKKAAILSKSKTQHFWERKQRKRNRKTKEN